MKVFDFMRAYNWGLTNYGKKWTKKNISWLGKFNGCEVVLVDKHSFTYKLTNKNEMNTWLFFSSTFIKEVRDV